MKKLILLLSFTTTVAVHAQDFDKNLASARSAYAAGNLEEARFAMQQMLTQIDIVIGNEVLKMLPTKMETLASNPKNDNVTANTGLAGAVIHRDYGVEDKTVNIEIMSNSPLVASLNAMLSLPFNMGNAGDGSQKTVKIQGYKSILQKSVDSETNQESYTLQIPMNSTLLTLTANNTNEAAVMKMANSLPVAQIAKMIQ